MMDDKEKYTIDKFLNMMENFDVICECMDYKEVCLYALRMLEISERDKNTNEFIIPYKDHDSHIELELHPFASAIKGIMFAALEHFDYREHGGNIEFGWLTDKGNELLKVLRQAFETNFDFDELKY